MAPRTHRILAALAFALALASGPWARDAAACEVTETYLGTGAQLPLGCPLHVYMSSAAPDTRPPPITALRGGVNVNVNGTVSSETLDLLITQSLPTCLPDGSMTMISVPAPFTHHAITLAGVTPGDAIGLGSQWLAGIQIVAAAPCPAPVVPAPACMEQRPCFFDDLPPDFIDSSESCAAGGGAPGGLALLAVAALVLARRAPRRRRR